MSKKGKKPTAQLTHLMKSKWPKLHEMVMKRPQIGIYVQAAVTGLLELSGVNVVDAECDCDCSECAVHKRRENRPHDVDARVILRGRKVPIQIGVFEGEFFYHTDRVTSEHYGVDKRFVNNEDTKLIRKKIRQTSPGGITLLIISDMMWPGDDWWYEGVDKRCVVLWHKGSCSIYRGVGGDVDAAKELCSALSCKYAYQQAVKPRRSPIPGHEKHLPFCPTTADGLAAAVRKDTKKWTGNPDDVVGALYYPAYASAYFDALLNDSDAVQTDGLVPILRHVAERHKESVAENAADEAEWRCSVSDALQALKKLARTDVKFGTNVLVKICHILQDVASGRYDDYACKTLSAREIDSRLHLKALFCLTCMIYRLRDRTPPDVRETLTAAVRIDGQDGMEHRIVLGYALPILQSAIPDWYAENKSLLFGEDSPDGMNSILVRVCSHAKCLDIQTMEKYHALVLYALGEEVRYIRGWESETGHKMAGNDLMTYFMIHILRGSRGYGIEDSVRDLTRIGPYAVSDAGHECGFLIMDKNTEKKIVDRGVQFWEAVLDLSPGPEALYGFGWWASTESVDQSTWERLTLRTCDAAGGLVEDSATVIDRASSNGNPTESGIKIIELILRADKCLLADLAVSYTIRNMQKNGVSIDVP